ncbi:PAAR-like domain-containing protein [Caballeronia mineralivorans]|uniref:PAAR-like domain-containing protein n=1 Tax=Caballeronia mineralivorans TaxID=2010198 RepID=UPI0023F2FD3B|nr:PAAR-like domain-containing protein [Caballeronia mineralivorans]MDB5781861.1 DNase/tRNase domain of colicin-like bacteriocin family protein [Caballeronia mineralivorans]
MADPLQVSISGDAADVFRQQFNIQNVGQARNAASNLDALWNTPNPWSQQGRPEDRETFDWAGQEVQKRFESGRYQPETDAQPSDHFSKGNRIATRQNGSFKAVSNTPDVCKTPMGSSTPPVPYQIVADLGGSTGIVPSVRFNGKPAYVLDQSVVPTCTGDEPGTANGVKSGTVGGEVKPTKGSSTVRAGGHAIIRDGDPCTMNNGNCTGTYVTAPSAGSSINASGNVVGDANPPPDKGVMHQVGGFFKGAGGALWDMGKGLVGLGVGAAKLSSVSQAAEGLSNATGLYNYHGYSETQQAVSQTAQAIYNHPGAIVDGITKPYTEAWAQGNYGEALGRGAIDVGGLFVGGVGAAGKAGEAANVAGEVGEAANAVGKAGEIANTAGKLGETADAAGQAGKAAEAGAAAAKGADATEGVADAGNAAEPAGDGTKIQKGKAKKPRKPREPRKYEKKVVNDDGSVTYTLKTEDGKLVNVTYKNGYPDFSPYKYDGDLGESEVKIDMTGNNNADFKQANQQARFGAGANDHPDGYTWHHNEDGTTMQLIQSDVHDAAPHTGGAASARANGGQ